MAQVHVTTRDGQKKVLDAENGRPLMEVLRDANLGIVGTCGGMCSCGTCHVYIAQTWAAKIPPRTEDEQMMLEGIGELVEVREDSRLSCQVMMEESLAGLEVEVGPIA